MQRCGPRCPRLQPDMPHFCKVHKVTTHYERYCRWYMAWILAQQILSNTDKLFRDIQYCNCHFFDVFWMLTNWENILNFVSTCVCSFFFASNQRYRSVQASNLWKASQAEVKMNLTDDLSCSWFLGQKVTCWFVVTSYRQSAAKKYADMSFFYLSIWGFYWNLILTLSVSHTVFLLSNMI